MRLGIYSDGPGRRVGGADGRVAVDAADHPFMTFALEVARHFPETVVFARVGEGAGDARFALPDHVRVIGLPDFGTLHDVRRVAGAAPGTVRAFWRGLAHVDAVWVFGPHPFAIVLALAARLRRKHVILGVRQDTRAYFDSRAAAQTGRAVRLMTRTLDRVFRMIARRNAVTAVGSEIARSYGAPSPRVHEMTVSLMRDADVAPALPARDWDVSPLRLLTVGRIDTEKNPMLLVDALVDLERRHPGRFHFTWVGAGPLRDAMRERADAAGVGAALELPGFIPFGPQLVARYGDAHAFVHVALTEGVPAVLVEAMAAGLPIVATDVGGVRAALGDGRYGLVVPPADLTALVAAIEALAGDETARRARAEAALIAARELTVERQTAAAAGFIQAVASRR